MINVIIKKELNLISGGNDNELSRFENFLRDENFYSKIILNNIELTCRIEGGKKTGEIILDGKNFGCGDIEGWLSGHLPIKGRRVRKDTESFVNNVKYLCCGNGDDEESWLFMPR
ncbi:MAG: hypothetical protein ACD_26C00065G0005 [uncultured bacterium]|nr:MAG: hypothetical protein ACD_26C00065G0005 [uncultured bacterium]